MKQKIISVLLAIIVILAILLGSLPVRAAETYLALGDSITTGFGLADKQASFPEAVAKENGYVLQNMAVDGSTIEDVTALVKSGEIDDAVKTARVITLTCGGNDFLNILCESVAASYNATTTDTIRPEEVFTIMSDSADTRRLTLIMRAVTVLSGNGKERPAFAESELFKKTLQNFSEALNSIVSHIREKNAEAMIIVATQYNPYKSFSGTLAILAKYVDEALVKLNQTIKDGAVTGGYTVCDVFEAFEQAVEPLCNADQKSMNFDFHPNQKGHAVLSACVNKTIKALHQENKSMKNRSAVVNFTIVTEFAADFQRLLQAALTVQ